MQYKIPQLPNEDDIAEEMKALRKSINSMMYEIGKYKESYLRAYLAETGLKPSELVLMEQKDGLTTRVWLEKR